MLPSGSVYNHLQFSAFLFPMFFSSRLHFLLTAESPYHPRVAEKWIRSSFYLIRPLYSMHNCVNLQPEI